MKLALLFTLTAAACGKAADVPALQDETLGMVSVYKSRFEAQAARHRALLERFRTSPAVRAAIDSDQIQSLGASTGQRLSEMSALVASAPTKIASRAAAESARRELITELGELNRRFAQNQTIVERNLGLYEDWLNFSELHPRISTTP